MKGRSITRPFLQNESHPDRRRGSPARPIPIVTAGVRPRMCRAAGRVADDPGRTSAVPTPTPEEIVRPAIARVPRTGRDPSDVRSFPW